MLKIVDLNAKDIGNIHIQHPQPLVAGQLVTVIFTYEVGSTGMSEGGRLRIALPNPGWGEPLVPQPYFWDCYQKGKDRRYTDYDRVNTTAKVISKSRKAVPFLTKWPGFRKPFGPVKEWLKNYDRWWIEVLLEDNGLDPGDKIILTYGDPQRKPLTARIQGFPDKKLCFLSFVEVGKNEFQEVQGSPWMISVESGSSSRIDAIAPSVVRPDEVPTILVSYTDAVKARARTCPDVQSLIVTTSEGRERTVPVKETSCSIRIDTPELTDQQDKEQSIRISVSDPQRAFRAITNPTLARRSGLKLFWGDLHVQSKYHNWSEIDGVGISCGTPDEIFDYAHNTAGLDFCAITDGGSILYKNGIWETVRDAALQANRCGEFVIFQGTELGDNVDGHRNIIFASEEPVPSIQATEDAYGGVSAHKVQEMFHGRDDVLLIYHHTKIWNNWSRWDPTVESVLEIYSAWGSGEKAGMDKWEVLAEMSGGAQEAWAKGYRLGVVAGSDTHVGTPGRHISNCERDEMLIYPNGITGVWAEELTRESIFEALKKRHCYGTTGVRIILEFFLEDNPMGSEVPYPEISKPREFHVNVWGTDKLDTVTIVKNNSDVYTFRPKSEQVQFVWEDQTDARTGDFYYVRVTQCDDNQAWSSPIWLDV